MLSFALAVASSPPLGLNATETGTLPVANGEPTTCVNAPVKEFTENTETVLSLRLAVASSPPPGLNATDNGALPVSTGEPATGVNAGGAASALAAPASKPTASTNPTNSNKRRTRPKPTMPVTFGPPPSSRASAPGQIEPPTRPRQPTTQAPAVNKREPASPHVRRRIASGLFLSARHISVARVRRPLLARERDAATTSHAPILAVALGITGLPVPRVGG